MTRFAKGYDGRKTLRKAAWAFLLAAAGVGVGGWAGVTMPADWSEVRAALPALAFALAAGAGKAILNWAKNRDV